MTTDPLSPIARAEAAFLEAGGTPEQWAAGVKRAIEAEISRTEADAAVQHAVDAALDPAGTTKPKSAIDQAIDRMRGRIRI